MVRGRLGADRRRVRLPARHGVRRAGDAVPDRHVRLHRGHHRRRLRRHPRPALRLRMLLLRRQEVPLEGLIAFLGLPLCPVR